MLRLTYQKWMVELCCRVSIRVSWVDPEGDRWYEPQPLENQKLRIKKLVRTPLRSNCFLSEVRTTLCEIRCWQNKVFRTPPPAKEISGLAHEFAVVSL